MDFGIVLMTPDDKGYADRDGSQATQPRARQNVVLEMGAHSTAMRVPSLDRTNETRDEVSAFCKNEGPAARVKTHEPINANRMIITQF